MSLLLDSALDARQLHGITQQLLVDGDCLQLQDHLAAVRARMAVLIAAGRDDEAVELDEFDVVSLTETLATRGVHSWRWHSDYEGDPGVINGVHDLSAWTCQDCGKVGSTWKRDPAYADGEPS